LGKNTSNGSAVYYVDRLYAFLFFLEEIMIYVRGRSISKGPQILIRSQTSKGSANVFIGFSFFSQNILYFSQIIVLNAFNNCIAYYAFGRVHSVGRA